MTKLLQQCILFFIVVVIPGHNLVNSQVSVNRTIGPTLVLCLVPNLMMLNIQEYRSLMISYQVSQKNMAKQVLSLFHPSPLHMENQAYNILHVKLSI